MTPLLSQLTDYLTARTSLREDWGGIWLTAVEVEPRFNPDKHTQFGTFARWCYGGKVWCENRNRNYVRNSRGQIVRPRFEFSPFHDEIAARESDRKKIDLPDNLTSAQRDIIQGIYGGMSVAKVGEWLGMPTRTVYWNLRQIEKKMGEQ